MLLYYSSVKSGHITQTTRINEPHKTLAPKTHLAHKVWQFPPFLFNKLVFSQSVYFALSISTVLRVEENL